MARTKQTSKRNRTDPDAPLAQPRLSQMQVEAWFEEEDERVAYRECLSVMDILVPKHLADDILPKAEYPEFWRLSMRELYFQHVVAAAFTTISLRDTLRADRTGAFQFCFKLRGREYMLTLQHLADAWGLRNEGAIFRSGSNPLGTWKEFDKLEAASFLNPGPAAGGKYPISGMSTTHRLLLYMVSYVLLPRKRNHGTTMEEDIPIVWAMVQEKQINWPYLIAHKMVKYSGGLVSISVYSYSLSSRLFDSNVHSRILVVFCCGFHASVSLGHAHLWTRILEMLGFDLTRERVVEPSRANPITRKNIHQMRRNLAGHAGEGGDEDEAADRDVPMEDVLPRSEAGTSSQVPPEAGAPPPVQLDYAEVIQQGFQELRIMMSEGFAVLSDRMDSLDIRMTSQSVNIQDLRSEFRSFRDSFSRPDGQGQQDPTPSQD
ncbi:hypothetical protein PIB30_086110 [Stylosanthes scabra]|uniref:Uncharacterized protein n=1 Tax=Stylosanthes scabra TaxID=79078 RepID=A0ABU6SVA1_9FABA|nr:hypothetical protein [Stylosanthes scabra]